MFRTGAGTGECDNIVIQTFQVTDLSVVLDSFVVNGAPGVGQDVFQALPFAIPRVCQIAFTTGLLPDIVQGDTETVLGSGRLELRALLLLPPDTTCQVRAGSRAVGSPFDRTTSGRVAN